MGLTVKNKNNFELSESLSDFFSLPIEEKKSNKYDDAKENIYKLDIDNEEKAYILNKINLLSTNISSKEKSSIEKEIDKFIDLYNL